MTRWLFETQRCWFTVKESWCEWMSNHVYECAIQDPVPAEGVLLHVMSWCLMTKQGKRDTIDRLIIIQHWIQAQLWQLMVYVRWTQAIKGLISHISLSLSLFPHRSQKLHWCQKATYCCATLPHYWHKKHGRLTRKLRTQVRDELNDRNLRLAAP